MSDLAERVAAAGRRIAGHVEQTPLVDATYLDPRGGGRVALKLENRQRTGSFKLRGACNRLLTLTADQRRAGVVAASSGNHGAAVAAAMRAFDIDGRIFVPEHTPAAKVANIEHHGGRVSRFGTDGLDTELHARAYAAEHGMFYVSPYNDVDVVAGQGTCGLEILEQRPGVEAVFVAVGGGGLISGVAAVLKQHDATIRIVGCQPLASPVMSASVAAGRILELDSMPTLSDGTAGGVEADSITFDWCRQLVDEWITVDEAAIADEMDACAQATGESIEGAAGVAIAGYRAALRADAAAWRGRDSVIIACGGNVDPQD